MNIAVILSGGVGSRMGLDIPKQYVMVNEMPVINYCLKTFVDNEMTHAIVIVVADEWKRFVEENVTKLNPLKPVLYAQPGETRQYSIYNALRAISDAGYKEDDYVIIHDAARPLITQDLINRCLEAVKSADAVLPVIRVKDTTYLSKDGKHIESLLNRSHLWNGQAPEAFRFGSYYEANMKLSEEELNRITGSTEVSYRAGLKCVLIPGDTNNFKITTPEDLSNFESIIKNEGI